MQNVLKYLEANWIGVGLGVIALLYALYEGTKRRGPRLAYQHFGQRLIGESADLLPDGLEVTYEGSTVRNLSLTRIVIWNAGRSPLRNSDIPQADPLKISFSDDSKILRAHISQITREVNGFLIDIEQTYKNSIDVEFDFIDPDDGALISVWHTSKKTDAKLSGTVIGQKSGPTSFGYFLWSGEASRDLDEKTNGVLEYVEKITSSPIFIMIIIFMGWCSFITFTVSNYYSRDDFPASREGDLFTLWMPVAFLTFFMFSLIWFFNLLRRRFPRKLLPENYRPPEASADAVAKE